MAKRPVPKYDFKAFGAAIKAAREGRKESRKKVGDEMFISPRYLANIENKGQHPSLQIFFELMLRYNISVDQFLLETPPEKNTQRRQLDALLDGMSDKGIFINCSSLFCSHISKTNFIYFYLYVQPPPTSAGGGLLYLQLYVVLPVLLLAPICGLLLLPHKPNDLLHLFGTEIVPYSPEITFHRIELRVFSLHLFQPLA